MSAHDSTRVYRLEGGKSYIMVAPDGKTITIETSSHRFGDSVRGEAERLRATAVYLEEMSENLKRGAW